MGYTTGNAKNKVAFFRANYNGTTWAILSGLTGTTAATAAANAAFTGEMQEETKVDFQEGAKVNISFTQYQDDADFYTFLDTVAPVTSSTSGFPEVIYENGNALNPASASGDYVLAILYGGEANGKVKVVSALGTIASTSGSFSQKNNTHTKPTLEFIGVTAPAELSITKGLYDTAIVTAPGSNVTMAEGTGYVRRFIDKKTS